MFTLTSRVQKLDFKKTYQYRFFIASHTQTESNTDVASYDNLFPADNAFHSNLSAECNTCWVTFSLQNEKNFSAHKRTY